ncbi:MAG: hypothetical protein K0S19_376 [Geminicoccaceae bacterium]|nr:hypothetical protein [Geminicoccaceae bacterium]
MLQEIRVRRQALPQAGRRRALLRYRFHDSGQVRGLGSVAGQFAHMTPNRVQLPTERFDLLGIVLQQKELVNQTSDNVPAQGKAGGRVPILLPLNSGALEKRLV